MNERVENFPENNLDSILEKIRVHAKNYRSVEEFLIHFVRTVDANQNGYLEFNEFAEGTKNLGLNLTYHELYTLMRRFDANGDFRLSMEELYNGITRGFA
eukprot:TRINITY_DN7644_c0_g1_i1.p2 TRINITY_DN7644_c0_g1~~TRINITY_DN7644_c0_g1_i1.p2  ORF type:complete len:100 (+),score=29.88 TRINITY_DN7644_c0_g1_i1:165-464(+)